MFYTRQEPYLLQLKTQNKNIPHLNAIMEKVSLIISLILNLCLILRNAHTFTDISLMQKNENSH